MRGLSLVAASGGHSSSQCVGLSLSWPLLLRSTASRGAGSVVVAHGPSCSAACGILPDQGSNPCPLHWQADSQLLRHKGSPLTLFFNIYSCYEERSCIKLWVGSQRISSIARTKKRYILGKKRIKPSYKEIQLRKMPLPLGRGKKNLFLKFITTIWPSSGFAIWIHIPVFWKTSSRKCI